jgi:hypothetical protein
MNVRRLSNISRKTNAMVVGATMLALMLVQTVSAGTVDPAAKGYNNLEMLTFFTSLLATLQWVLPLFSS